MEKLKLILHIGRHKTGTTALQDYMFTNKDYLYGKGYYYFDLFRRESAHHLLSEYLSSQDFLLLESSQKSTRIKALQNEIISNIKDKGKSKATIISSEAFQNTSPKIIRELFSEDIFDVKVIAYFREIVGYTSSSYNQEIHAKLIDEDLDVFVDRFKPNYLNFADEWSKLFSNFKAKIFDSSNLYNANIIDDFFIEELNITTIDGFSRKSNPSLSRKYLSFKYEYNKRALADELPHLIEPGKLYTILGNLSIDDEKFMLSPEQRERILRVSKNSDSMFYEKYIGEGGFSYQAVLEGRGIIDMKGKDFWDIYNIIDNHKWPI